MEIIDFLARYVPDREGFEAEYQRLAASGSPCEAEMARMMLRLFERLRRGMVGPVLHGFKIVGHELNLQYHHGNCTATVKVRIDYKDYSPLVDGVPALHYRLASSVEDKDSDELSTDELRTPEVDRAYEFVLDAVRASKREF